MTSAAVISSRRTARTLRPEYVLAPGPLILGQPGAGTFAELYGGSWALLLTSAGPQLMQAQGGAWLERTDAAALAGLQDAVHVSLAFDQAARPVVAWESGGNVSIRQWNGAAYVTRGPFPGCDPLLLCDALIMFQPQISDVILCHLSPERDRVLTRTQREGYAVPRVAATVPSGTVLDQAITYPYAWAALGEADGAALSLRSELYPVSVSSRVGAAMTGLGGGTYRPSVLVTPLSPHGTSGAMTGLGGGVWDSPVLRDTAGNALRSGIGSLSGGAWASPVLRDSAGNALSSSFGSLSGGRLTPVVIVTPLSLHSTQAAMSGLTGGSWNA